MDRKTITQFALAALGDDHDWTVDKALANWWSGAEDTDSLQLNLAGNRIFHKLFDNWTIDISGIVISPDVIIRLCHLNCPWYLHRPHHSKSFSVEVILYGGREALAARLYVGKEPKLENTGAVKQWLKSLG